MKKYLILISAAIVAQACTKELTDALLEEIVINATEINIDEFGDEILAGNDLIGLYPFLTE